MHFNRRLSIENPQSSLFLFGPRMTGKTTMLRAIKNAEYFNLLDPQIELNYQANPQKFWSQISALPHNSLIIIDEIQKIPLLLNYVQMGIDQMGHIFVLSGSSARKLKRGAANLLGGRAVEKHLYPLSAGEIGPHFRLDYALKYGTLPNIYNLLLNSEKDLAIQHLKSYVSVYLKEEIQSEALTRNLGAFNRFLNIAAESNAQVIEFANISRESAVPASTVKEYYQILQDTLLGHVLWPYSRKERKKAHPKFYFFDCGVIRSIQNRLTAPPNGAETGFLFETWLINELKKIRDYSGKEHSFSFWRQREHEIDILISGGHGPILAIECKSGRTDIKPTTIRAFRKYFPKVELIIASLTDERPKKQGDTLVLPWQKVLEKYAEQ